MALKSCSEIREKFLKGIAKEYTNVRKQKLMQFKGNIDNEMIETYSNQNTISLGLSYSNGMLNKECHPSNKYTLSFTYSSVCPVAMTTYCPQYITQATYTVPIIINKWSPIVTTVPTNVYSAPVPQVPFIANTHAIPSQLCPYTGGIITEPLITTVIPQTIIPEHATGSVENFYKPNACYLESINDQIYYKPNEDITAEDVTTSQEELSRADDPLQLYLNLPRELFPSARSLALDPNPIIDELCKQSKIEDHAAWILDLEFGIPRVAITRAIPIYDVKFNSIHCKNTPSAIHPGFESCDENLKRVLLFYYDCIVSAWYRGYVIVNNDRSVENFQAWLLIAMQFFGMCWP